MNEIIKKLDPEPSTPPPTLWTRLNAAFGPVAGGMLIDFVDFATFGPIGLLIGPLAGGAVAWWLCTFYRLTGAIRWATIVAASIYCFVPFTEIFPLATLVAATGRFVNPSLPAPPGGETNDA